MRICSLLPSATEMLFLLGLGDQIVAVSNECDYPPEANAKRRVVRTAIDQERATSGEIHQQVQTARQHSHSLYEIDLEALRELAPDLIITQELCDVCAISSTQVLRDVSQLPSRPRIISLHPHTLDDVLRDLAALGEAAGASEQAAAETAKLRSRIETVRTLTAGRQRRKVACIEWLDPLMSCGHWVPEMLEYAGGQDTLAKPGDRSRVITWEEVRAADPDVLLVMPCGFSIERTQREMGLLTSQAGWSQLRAVREGEVYLVNGPAYFNRAGPRLVGGIELMAALLHPDRCASLLPSGSSDRWTG